MTQRLQNQCLGRTKAPECSALKLNGFLSLDFPWITRLPDDPGHVSSFLVTYTALAEGLEKHTASISIFGGSCLLDLIQLGQTRIHWDRITWRFKVIRSTLVPCLWFYNLIITSLQTSPSLRPVNNRKMTLWAVYIGNHVYYSNEIWHMYNTHEQTGLEFKTAVLHDLRLNVWYYYCQIWSLMLAWVCGNRADKSWTDCNGVHQDVTLVWTT